MKEREVEACCELEPIEGVAPCPASTDGSFAEAGTKRPDASPATRYFLLVAAVLLLGAAGYAGYVLYPRFDLPPVEGVSLFLLAAGAGVASFFSPCVFPLLLTLLARQSSREREGAFVRPLTFASLLSGGAAVFLLLSGTVIAVGGGTLLAGLTFSSTAGQVLRFVIGIFLLSLGLAQLGFLPTPFQTVERLGRPLLKERTRRRQSVAIAMFLFGFGYLLAGFC